MNAATQSGTVTEDVRPVVRTTGPSNLGVWIFGALLLAGGLSLFLTLNARRQDMIAPATAAGPGGAVIAAPPPLSLPQAYPEPVFIQPGPLARAPFPVAAPVAQPQVITRIIERPSTLGPDDLVGMNPPPAPVVAQPAF